MLKKLIFFATLLGLFLLVDVGVAHAQAKPGSSCNRVGTTSGDLICIKQGAKLIWKTRLSQSLAFVTPADVAVTQGRFQVIVFASSSLPINVRSLTQDRCVSGSSWVEPVTPGLCRIEARQNGNKTFAPIVVVREIVIRGENRISFQAPDKALVSEKQVRVTAYASSGLPVVVASRSQSICQVEAEGTVQLLSSGNCVLEAAQNGDQFYPMAVTTVTFPVLAPSIITFDAPTQLLRKQSVTSSGTSVQLTPPKYSLDARTTAGVSVTFSSNSNGICSVESNVLTLLSRGVCTVTASQSSTGFYAAAEPVIREIRVLDPSVISFEPVKQILLSSRTYSLVANSTAPGPITFSSTSRTVCTLNGTTLTLLSSGNCTVSATQSAVEFYAAAESVTRSITISTARSVVDQPDMRSGYQLHFVYVVPSDRPDLSLDINGTITRWIDEGQRYLRSQISAVFPIDSTPAGYDIQYLKSRYSTAELSGYSYTCQEASGLVAAEIGVPCSIGQGFSPGTEKYYVLLVDIPSIAGRACGYAGMPGRIAVVAIGETWNCYRAAGNWSTWRVQAWIHETLHGLGVDHVPAGVCDLMLGSSLACSFYAMDRERKYYVGSASAGVNILNYSFWIRDP